VAFMATSCGMCGRELAPSLVKEIATERIDRNGDTWQVQFTSTFNAPPDKVYDAFTHPERVKEFVPENVLKSDLVTAEDNKKTVDVVGRLDILPPGFKVQNLRIEYTYFPDQKRITSRTIDFKLADINSEYRFEPSPDGNGTVLKFSQTSKDKAPMIVESLQKGALRENYATQVKAANRALGLEPKEPAAQAG
jgi:uncharacterized protein YndB with AHSA1/START domain